MAIDVLQDKIRKTKNPCAVVLCAQPEVVPPSFLEGAESLMQGVGNYFCGLLDAIKNLVPAVRVDFASFALYGPEGMEVLLRVLKRARELRYYVILDWLRLEGAAGAEQAAKLLLRQEVWPCDGVNLCVYGGSDVVKPYVSASAATKKDVFVTLKTANKSGSELQDLQTGGRVVYTAAADLVNRWGEGAVGRCGYSRIAAGVGANNAGSIKNLRQKYPGMFLLVDGIDGPGGNAKNASYAFDTVGHGALCCAVGVVDAWVEAMDIDPLEAAVAAVDRLKRNINRYVVIL